MKAEITMTRTVSVTEAQSKLSSLVEWTNQNQDSVVVERRGKPAAALISYADYEELARLRQQEKKRKALETLRAIRQQVRAANADLSASDAYRFAGFGEEVIQRILAKDEELAKTTP